ncbi:MAG: hypothetical protein HC880_13585 [Bacteroidia bacterium]|nr:hypothetical protein [Bacteroidia bacterium]
MDNNPGMDYFCILYSTEKLNLNDILQRMKSASGNFMQRLQQSIGDKLMPPYEVQYESGETIAFKGMSKDKTVVPIVVAINHLK